MKSNKQSKKQKRANARNQLFRQIYGYNLGACISRARIENAITDEEIEYLDIIQDILSSLKQKYFDNSKKLGLHPRRRCYCGDTAKWCCTDIFGNTKYLCSKHKEILGKYEYLANCKSINPYD
jgi:type IV secretory pathway VirB4 component|nr:MAG TPA: hypothetical protein [Crassvirales sp.]